MEFLDEEPKPRFLIQSRSIPSTSSSPLTQTLNKTLIFFCFSLSISLFVFAIFFLESQTIQFLIIWSASSLLFGSFAPNFITGGDIRVGQGRIIEFPDSDDKINMQEDSIPTRRSRVRNKSVNSSINSHPVVDTIDLPRIGAKITGANSNGKVRWIKEEENGEAEEWNTDDVVLLKKQMAKHPLGIARRWEIIAEAFRGRHKAESVVKMAKALGEKKPGNISDSYAQFLKNRKSLDKRVEDETVENDDVEVNWSSSEDIALLNGLKAFPKDASMRWDKIATSVPGRSKADCLKRVGELKKGFRNSKSSVPDV